MNRFLALLCRNMEAGNRECYRAAASRFLGARSDWQVIRNSDRLFLGCERGSSRLAEPHIVAEQSVVAFGTAFDMTSEPQSACLQNYPGTGFDTHALTESRGKIFTSRFWGSYVLLHWDATALHVLRSVMATEPCFYWFSPALAAVFSHVDDFFSVGVAKPQINWDCIRAQAANRDYLTRETSLLNIWDLLPGERLVIGPTQLHTEAFWSPARIAKSNPIDSFALAAQTLRRETLRSVQTWGYRFRKIVLAMSGGIDSSIVLACLVKGRGAPQVTGLNLYSEGAEDDERPFARSMARDSGVQLIETARNRDVDLKMFLNCALTARPVLHFTGCDSYPKLAQLARSIDAEAVFDGELGDAVYGCSIGPEAVAETIWRVGWRRPTLLAARNYAILKRMSVWQVLRLARAYGSRVRELPYWSMHAYARAVLKDDPFASGLVSADALHAYEEQLERFVHPWLCADCGTPPGRILLIYGLISCSSTAYHQPFQEPDDSPVISPLASQPLVEAALRVESRLHTHDGMDRAAARAAFAHELSDLVYSRRGKASPRAWIEHVVRQNLPFLREVLLEGWLVKNRILDRQRLEQTLSGTASRSLVRATDIFIQLYIESWLRHWVTR